MSKNVVPFVDPDVPALGSTVGPWLLLERIDSGSYGRVYLAQRAGHPESPPVALKMAKQPWDPRFEREAALLQRVQHSSVPGYEDSGVWTAPSQRRYPYVVMELVRGFTLYDWFREQPRSSQQVLQVLAQVARGLEAVHARATPAGPAASVRPLLQLLLNAEPSAPPCRHGSPRPSRPL